MMIPADHALRVSRGSPRGIYLPRVVHGQSKILGYREFYNIVPIREAEVSIASCCDKRPDIKTYAKIYFITWPEL